MSEILRNIYLFILTGLVLYALARFGQIKRAGGQLLVVALVLSLLTDAVAAVVIALTEHISMSWLFNLFTIAIFPVYLFVLRDSLAVFHRKMIPYLAGGFVLLGLGNFFFLQGIHHFNQFTLLLGASLLIVYCLLYFKSRFDNPNENLVHSWRFWVATGLLAYFTGTLFYFGFIHYLYSLDAEWSAKVNIILQLMNIMLYSLFGIALLCLTRRPR